MTQSNLGAQGQQHSQELQRLGQDTIAFSARKCLWGYGTGQRPQSIEACCGGILAVLGSEQILLVLLPKGVDYYGTLQSTDECIHTHLYI